MATSGLVALDDVWAALRTCLPRWEAKKKQHNWWVYPPDGGPMFALPLGPHGRRDNVSIQRGHVKRMANQFGIAKCMREQISGL